MVHIRTYSFYSENFRTWIHIDARNKKQALKIARSYEPGTKAYELSLLMINGHYV